MKKNYTLGLVLCYNLLSAQVFPVTQIINNGSDAQRINFVMMSDGYTAAELAGFITDATGVSSDFFAKSPFAEYSNFFNVYAIEVPSNESGADHPATAGDEAPIPPPVSVVDTYFDSTFDFNGIHRLLVPTNGGAVYAVAGANFPSYDQIIIMVNSPMYGGSGGAFATNSLDAAASELAIHEVGHSFAGLADEYWSGATSERPNRTAESNPSLVKWRDWVGINSVGVYAYGASAPASNYFRPHQNCEMRYLNRSFCSVCKERIVDRIYELTDPIDNYAPSSNTLNFTGSTLDFSLDLVLPSPNTLTVEWTLNGTSFATGDLAIMLNSGDLPLATNTLVATITDGTSLSKSYLPASGYVFSVSWAINNTILPIDLVNFQAVAKEAYVRLDWSTNTEVNVDKYEIERSSDASNFEKIDELVVFKDTEELQSRTVLDVSPLEGKSYYRLKIIDKDGHFEYSPIRSVNRVEKFFFKVYPNPTQDQIYVDYFINSFEKDFIIELYDASGQRLQIINADGKPGKHQSIIDITSYPKGSYFLQINEKNHTQRVEIIKQ